MARLASLRLYYPLKRSVSLSFLDFCVGLHSIGPGADAEGVTNESQQTQLRVCMCVLFFLLFCLDYIREEIYICSPVASLHEAAVTRRLGGR